MKFIIIASSLLLFAVDTSAANKIVEGLSVKHSEDLCPFTIGIYPSRLLAGDVVYARLDFTNTRNTPVWAPATPLYADIDFGILTYYFMDKEENQYVWKKYMWPGNSLGKGFWQEIAPGEKGVTQYEMFDYVQTRKLKCWEEMITHPMEGRLMVRLACHQNTPPLRPQLLVTNDYFYLTISPRSPEETKLIESALSCEKYQAVKEMLESSAFAFDAYEGTSRLKPTHCRILSLLDKNKGYSKEELLQISEKISEGTLKNIVRYQAYLVGLAVRTKEQNVPEQLKILKEIEQWLVPLNEIERENLKIYGCVFKDCFRIQDDQVLLDKCDAVFGKKPPFPLPLAE